MSSLSQRITPFLWFNDEAEEAVDLYTSVFDHSRIVKVARYGKASAAASGRPEGSAMTIAFELDGQNFTALNGGPAFTFTPAVSLMVNCQTQDEIDRYWQALSKDGDAKHQQCGWLKDRFGLSWQIVPVQLGSLLTGADPARAQRVMQALMTMKKLDLAALCQAADAA